MTKSTNNQAQTKMSDEERISFLASAILDTIEREDEAEQAKLKRAEEQSLLFSKVGGDHPLMQKLEERAKEEGTPVLDFMAKNHPELTDIFIRMIEGELAAIGYKPSGTTPSAS